MIIDPVTGLKRCSVCKKQLPASAYRPQKGKNDGLRTACRGCLREIDTAQRIKEQDKRRAYSYLGKRSKAELKGYSQMFEKQKGACAICGTTTDPNERSFAIDHDHVTGKIRGLLCTFCNTAIGLFKDDTALLLNAIDYLEKHKEDS